MGFSPSEVNSMSLFEFECAYAGWQKANYPADAEKAPAMSGDRLAELGIEGFN